MSFTKLVLISLVAFTLIGCDKRSSPTMQATAVSETRVLPVFTIQEFINRFGMPRNMIEDGNISELTYEGINSDVLSGDSSLIGFVYTFENDYLVSIGGVYGEGQKEASVISSNLEKFKLESGYMLSFDIRNPSLKKEKSLSEFLNAIKFVPNGLKFTDQDRYQVLSIVTSAITIMSDSREKIEGKIYLKCDLIVALSNNFIYINEKIKSLSTQGKVSISIEEFSSILDDV